MGVSSLVVTSQLKKESVTVASGTCPSYPIELMSALGVIIVALVLPLGIAANKIKNLSNCENVTQLTEFDSATSKNAPKEANSVEASLKRGEDIKN